MLKAFFLQTYNKSNQALESTRISNEQDRYYHCTHNFLINVWLEKDLCETRRLFGDPMHQKLWFRCIYCACGRGSGIHRWRRRFLWIQIRHFVSKAFQKDFANLLLMEGTKNGKVVVVVFQKQFLENRVPRRFGRWNQSQRRWRLRRNGAKSFLRSCKRRHCSFFVDVFHKDNVLISRLYHIDSRFHNYSSNKSCFYPMDSKLLEELVVCRLLVFLERNR